MNLLAAFLRLIRSVNLLFIAITMLLFQYCIVGPVLAWAHAPVVLTPGILSLLIIASVLIAAAGYIINDYFDLNIDLVNKPQKLVVEKVIKRRWAILWHLGFSAVGILLSAVVAWKTRAWWLIPANTGCVAALWLYSTNFKKQLLTGNVIISMLTGWVILVIGFITHYEVIKHPELYTGVDASSLLRRTFLYAAFAFIISLIREVVKDIEDMQGDALYGCKTMPIVWGVNVAKIFAATWLLMLIAAVAIIITYVLPLGWWWAIVYCVLLILIPLLYILRKLVKATATKDYHQLSNWLKLAMLSGILSMLFFKFYS